MTRLLCAMAFMFMAVACPRPRPEYVRADDAARVAAASEHGWRAAGLPEPGACLARLRITWTADAGELERLCGADAMQCLLGSRVVLSPGASPKDAIHEGMHALFACTVYDEGNPNPHRCKANARDFYDYCHADPRVWVDYPRDNPGGRDSAQGRAREAYDAIGKEPVP